MLKRIVNLFKGFLGLFISGMESKNVEALLENEKENLRKQISEYNTGLISQAGLCERLKIQTARQKKEVAELTSKAGAHLKAGNKKLAGEYALKLQNLKEDLAENQEMLDQAEESYAELKRAMDVAVTNAKEKIEELGRSINETKVAKATAELTEMASGLITKIGGSGDTLNRLEETISKEKEEAKGRARVAKDSMDTSDLDNLERERAALEEIALADFATSAGIVLSGEQEVPHEIRSAEKIM